VHVTDNEADLAVSVSPASISENAARRRHRDADQRGREFPTCPDELTSSDTGEATVATR